MAITKIHPIKRTVGKSIAYIGNEIKTGNGEYITAFGCAYETAELEFALTAQSAKGGGQNQAYHLIQSFKPGEVTAEQCHKIGRKFADAVLGGRYEYILCTHTDKEHYHNHIIFNAVSFKDNKRYRSDKKSYYRIRSISDKICVEYGLNTIRESERRRSYDYKKTYVSSKYRIKRAIDECILYAADYEDFIQRMENMNYEIRQDEFLWFRNKDNKRFTKTDTIGKAYSRGDIEKRIKGIYRPSTVDLLIDIERNVKCRQSKGYEQWAKIHNLKLISKTLVVLQEKGLMNYDELSKRVSEKSEKIKTTGDRIKADKKRINELDTIMKNLNAYKKLKPIYDEYARKNSLLKNGFYNKHKQEIDLFKHAAEELKPYTVKNKLPSIKQLKTEKQKLQADVTKQSTLYAELKSEYSDISALKNNVDIFLKKTPELNIKEKKQSILKRLAVERENAQPTHQNHKEHNHEL